MGILNQPESRPAFETETETTIETETMTQNTVSTVVEAPAVQAPVAVAQAAPAPAKKAAKFQMALEDQKFAFPEDAVIGLSLAVPRIKGEQGAAYIKEESLGSRFRMTVESWNPRFLISAGISSSSAGYKESMDFIRNSYDGVTIPGETMTVPEYVQYLKDAHGYNKANANPYIDIWGFVTWTEKKGDVPQEDRSLYMLQASKTSAGNFTAFCTAQGVMRSQGILSGEIEEIEVVAQPQSKDAMKYTNFSFSLPKKK